MEEWKIGYLAGIIDGEGSISIAKGNQKNYSYSVTVTNSHLPTLEFLQREFGGNLHSKAPDYHKRSHMLRWVGNKGKEILRLVSGKLSIKKELAELYLLFPLGLYRGAGKLTKEEHQQREVIELKIRNLNSRYGMTFEFSNTKEGGE